MIDVFERAFCGEYISSGYYSRVYELKGDNTKVVKIGDCSYGTSFGDSDATRDYLEAIHKGYIEEEFTPVVHEFVDTSMYFQKRGSARPYLCVMDKYRPASCREYNVSELKTKLESMKKKLQIQGCEMDLHSANIMMNEKGKAIVIDPFAMGTNRPRTTMLLNKRVPVRSLTQYTRI